MSRAVLLLGLAIAVGGDTTSKAITNEPVKKSDSEPKTVEEALQERRCIPTAVARGPCHMCVCTERGAYQCRSEDCAFDDKDSQTKPAEPECEPGMLYNEGTLWCNCDAAGFWKSANCRANFRYVRNKKTLRQGPDIPPNFPCDKGSLYAVECNVCECRDAILTPAACTGRTCLRTRQATACKLGQVHRDEHQLCACNKTGYYVDELCINLLSDEAVQKIDSKAVRVLTGTSALQPAPDKCEPDSVLQRDCNRCTCTKTGELVCTNKPCLSSPSAENVSVAVEKALRRPSKHALLPELQSERDRCEPGAHYRLQCNTCYCTQRGVPACTTMLCLDTFALAKRPVTGTNKNHSMFELPKIKVGDTCTQGISYRLDCNVCRCTANNRLICTKKLCLSVSEMDKTRLFEKKMIERVKKIIPEANKDVYMEMFDDKVVIHQRVNKNAARDSTKKNPDKDDEKKESDSKSVHEIKSVKTTKFKETTNDKVGEKEKIDSKPVHKIKSVKTTKLRETTNDKKEKKNPINKNKDNEEEAFLKMSTKYPILLPNKKCKPGQIYQKGCQRCFCTYKKIAKCTNRPCNEMAGPVQVPKDVYPRLLPKEVDNLPTLPHEAARCKPGREYTVDCNVCLCLANGNLLCDTQLCLAVEEVNRIAADKRTGKPCKHPDTAVNVDCISCSCVQGAYECAAVPDCVPDRFRRALHGDLDPRVNPRPSLDDTDGNCMPGMVYKQNCNNCYCQEDGSLRCTRKGCLNFQQVQKLKEQRQRLLKLGL